MVPLIFLASGCAGGPSIASLATPTLTWTIPAPISYGTALSSTQLNATAILNGVAISGTYNYSPAAGIILQAGIQPLNVTFTPTDNTKYGAVTATVNLVVNKAQPTISWATPASIAYGTALSSLQLNAAASMGSTPLAGTFTYLMGSTPVSTGTVLAAGTDTLTATFTPTDYVDYSTASASVSIVVSKATPTINWQAPSTVITVGTVLDSTILDAKATIGTTSVAGSYVYNPAVGTVLNSLGWQILNVTFLPSNTSLNAVTASILLDVGKAIPTISWPTPAPIPYGTALSSTQLDASTVVPGSFSYSPAIGTVLAAGAQTLTALFSPTDSTTYTPVSTSVSLTVTKAIPTITWPTPTAISYGTALSSTQLDATTTVSGVFTYSPTIGSMLSSGIQTLTATFAPTDSANYAPTTASVNLTVNKVTPTITWPTPAAISYGTPLSVAQLDAATTVPGSFTYSPALGAVLLSGKQTLTVTFNPTDSVDYASVVTSVQLVVSQNTPTITWSTPAPVPVGRSLTSTQLDALASYAGISIPGTFIYNPALGTVLQTVGSVTLSLTFYPTDTVDYASTTASVQLIVQGPPMITWPTPAAIFYGTALSNAQLDAAAPVTGSFSYSPALGAVLAVGTQTLTATFTPTDLLDYQVTTASVQLVVNKINSVITWNTPASINYGTALSSTQLNATASVPGSFSYSPAVGSTLTAGTHTLTATFTPTDSNDYASATATVQIVVSQNTPTITWATPSAIQTGTAIGSTQLNATATLNGSSVSGSYVYSPAAGTAFTFAGPETLKVTFTPSDQTDYKSATASVTLIVQGTPAITWGTPSAITYGTALDSTELNATASVPGTFTYTPAAGTISPVGTKTLSVTFNPTDSVDYTTATASVQLVVNKATPVIIWATPASIAIGTTLSSTQLDATANVPGNFIYTPAAGTVESTIGSLTLTATFTPTDYTDYNSATASVTLAVTPPGPSYSWKNVTITGGGYVPAVYFHPTQQGLMYARTDIGGVYRWNTATDTGWVPLNDSFGPANWWYGGAEAIGLDPTNPQMLYMAVGMYALESWDGNGAMLVSTDQGATFTTVPLTFQNGSNDTGRNTGERISVDPNKPSIVYFGTRLAGVQISTNSGLVWSQMSGFPSITTSNTNGSGVVATIPIKSSGSSGTATPVIYAAVAGTGVSEPSGLYVTTNGGSISSTWTAVSGQPTGMAVLQAKLGPSGALYLLYGDQTGPGTMTTCQFWKFVPGSTWTSGTWTQITLPRTGGYGGFALDPSVSGYILLDTLDQYTLGDTIFRSTNDGTTWVNTKTLGAINDASLSPWVAFGGSYTNVATGNWATGVAIDPFSSAHAMYGDGQTIWTTNNLTAADTNGTINWQIGAQGIEETAVSLLVAPPSGSTLLYSGMADLYGFAHQNLSVSPPQQMFSNPQAVPTSIDFEQQFPSIVVRISHATAPFGVYSTNSGLTWTAFGNNPTGTTVGGGTVAIAPDGSSIVWAPADTASVWYSTNFGGTWTAATGVPSQATVVSDRVAVGVYYATAGTSLYMSTNGGKTWTTQQTGLQSGGSLVAMPDAQGHLWFTSGTAGTGSALLQNTGTATSPILTANSYISGVSSIGFGLAQTGSTHLTLYTAGTVSGTYGIYRSVDGGTTWVLINDANHQWGIIQTICGDMRTFGTVYIGTNGRGIIWGTSTY
jgi:hypothetical protein